MIENPTQMFEAANSLLYSASKLLRDSSLVPIALGGAGKDVLDGRRNGGEV